jgi:hypothetical protein
VRLPVISRNSKAALSDRAIDAVFRSRTAGRRKREEARRLREATFPPDLLQGTETWAALWESAMQFPGARIPRQALARGRQRVPMRSLPAGTESRRDTPAQAVREPCSFCRRARTAPATGGLRRQRKAFAELKTTTEAVDETLKELRIDHEALADAISAALRSNEKRHAAVLAALEDDKDLPEDCAALVPVWALADVLARQLDDRIKGAGVCAHAVPTDHHAY